jgi:hypothetical protein
MISIFFTTELSVPKCQAGLLNDTGRKDIHLRLIFERRADGSMKPAFTLQSYPTELGV